MGTTVKVGGIEYGQIREDGGQRKLYAHRASWLVFCGVIPEGMRVLNRHGVSLCIAPDHLFLGTHRSDVADAKMYSRNARWCATLDG